MDLTPAQLARMMDLSAVRTDVDLDEIRVLAETCKQYGCVCAFAMPCYVPELVRLLADTPEVGVGGVVGFPSGACDISIKVAEACQQLEQGAVELDMVMNVGFFRSGWDERVEDEIQVVVQAAHPAPVKVIIEAHYLTADEIVRASRLAVRAGAAFVKTGTGWAETGATLENVRLIKSAIGDAAQVKAAGGVRDFQTVREMIRLGVSRFGVGLASGLAILDQCASHNGLFGHTTVKR